jgi:hypothetical protein
MGSMEDFQREAWGLRPILDVPGLYPPAVLFTILDSDPRPKYRDQLKRIQEKADRQVSDSGSSPDAKLMQQSQLSAAWDLVFRDVPGDRITLLFQNPERPASQQGVPKESGSVGPAYAVMIKSNAPPGTKWLATRSTRLMDQVVCWCLPVELETGKSTDVALTLRNIIVLDSE